MYSHLIKFQITFLILFFFFLTRIFPKSKGNIQNFSYFFICHIKTEKSESHLKFKIALPIFVFMESI